MTSRFAPRTRVESKSMESMSLWRQGPMEGEESGRATGRRRLRHLPSNDLRCRRHQYTEAGER